MVPRKCLSRDFVFIFIRTVTWIFVHSLYSQYTWFYLMYSWYTLKFTLGILCIRFIPLIIRIRIELILNRNITIFCIRLIIFCIFSVYVCTIFFWLSITPPRPLFLSGRCWSYTNSPNLYGYHLQDLYSVCCTVCISVLLYWPHTVSCCAYTCAVHSLLPIVNLNIHMPFYN